MTEHTPGPWEWQELDGSDEDVELWAIEADVSVVILDSGFAISAQSDSTWPADKALIAAAPETKRQRDLLLAACEANEVTLMHQRGCQTCILSLVNGRDCEKAVELKQLAFDLRYDALAKVKGE